ncbi:PQQ-dependent sugar dehydrogenase [Haloarcula sp. CBA1130]|uniref:PQQ-dependent sugar dehydrogenase n=1 Tax=unclassified Haloarcula TaxID=2624677 RepID=UPI0012487FE6|nr:MULTISPECIES: PQQ-dependent sugar dehydrogenase [unclassified Haloarcula]KAA9399651.1 PQQ-dependent sugar dehydrogenase [Haloarcula sp. CBA1129]KAA9401375.1 PQQ-dependent sugar dehydrogenase [Haloarcula sp. CBA1130]
MRNPSRNARSRRQYLGALASIGATGLAGCRGEPETRTDSSDQTSTVTTTAGPVRTLDRYDVSLSHERAQSPSEWVPPTTSPMDTPLGIDPLIEDLEIPWDLSFAADGTLFLTERVGRVLSFADGTVRTVAEPAAVIDAESSADGWWVTGGEGGTLGIAAHPSYPDPPVVYVYYTTMTGDDERSNRVVAMDVSAEDPAATESVLVDDIPGSKIHNGGRLTFGPENYLWITTGDAGVGSLAADLDSLGGKVLRVTPAGDPAPGNPDLGGDPRVFTYGHRNPQGLAWLPDGTLVASEHGPTGRDELNRLVAGGYYGWPDTREHSEYLDAGPEVRRPLANTGNTGGWAPSGSLFYTGDAVPSLQNRLLTGGLKGQKLLVTTLTPAGNDLPPGDDAEVYDADWTDDAYTATTHSLLADELGRIRHVEQGPDGGLYLVTSNRDGRAGDGFPRERDDVLVRVTPAD